MFHQSLAFVLLAPALLLTACQGLTHRDTSPPTDYAVTVRNKGYALLYSTIHAESKLAQVLMIKDPDPQVADLIRAIGQFAGETQNKLQAFAKEDATLDFDSQGLPEVETATRDSISSATGTQVLFSGGRDFEFKILLTQHEALNYIAHLAEALSKQDTHKARKSYLEQLAKDSKALHERVIAQLEAPYVEQAK